MQGKEQLTEMLELTENADKLGLTDKEFRNKKNGKKG